MNLTQEEKHLIRAYREARGVRSAPFSPRKHFREEARWLVDDRYTWEAVGEPILHEGASSSSWYVSYRETYPTNGSYDKQTPMVYSKRAAELVMELVGLVGPGHTDWVLRKLRRSFSSLSQEDQLQIVCSEASKTLARRRRKLAAQDASLARLVPRLTPRLVDQLWTVRGRLEGTVNTRPASWQDMSANQRAGFVRRATNRYGRYGKAEVLALGLTWPPPPNWQQDLVLYGLDSVLKQRTEWIESHRPASGRWNKAALAELGVPWPAPKGWRDKLLADGHL